MMAKTRYLSARSTEIHTHTQRGVALVVVLLVLVVASLLGVAASQISIMGERGARNDRDIQIARQSAEAALLDAENDIMSVGAINAARSAAFATGSSIYFSVGCGKGAMDLGLCAEVLTGKPAWLDVDIASAATTTASAQFGQFTGAIFQSGSSGVRPAQAPRYIIEKLDSLSGAANAPAGTEVGLTRSGVTKAGGTMYRITAVGFGPRTEVQSVLQTIFRREQQ